MFNTIQIYGKELFNDENIFFTLLIGLLILFFIHKLFFDKNQAIAPPEDIKQCLQRFNSSKIYEYPNLLSDAECDKVIELSRDKVQRSSVIGESKKNDISEVRTSKNTFLRDSVDPLMKSIDDRIEKIIGISPDKYEDLQVVHYQPGQFYKAHWDACDPKKDPRCVEDHKKGGLRFATFIIYLNDDMEGGETEFPLMNRKISPEKGKGVLFFDLEDNLTERRELSKHAGLPPTSGEKWMCNKWIRLNKFPR